MVKRPTKFKANFIDGDVLRYRCGFAVEYTLYHVEGLLEPLRGKKELTKFMENHPYATFREEKVVEPSSHAIHIVKQYLAQMEQKMGCRGTIILSGKTNFREDIATIKPYKGNRPDRKPQAYGDITNWFKETGAIFTDGIEADDLMAIRANQIEDSVISTNDKDLLQVPGWHYNFIEDSFIYIDEDQGFYNLCVQILAGDPVDNIQGIPGIGVKKAEKILEGTTDKRSMFLAVRDAYEGAFGEHFMHFLNENAALVYMLRFPEDYWEIPYRTEEDSIA